MVEHTGSQTYTENPRTNKKDIEPGLYISFFSKHFVWNSFGC